MSPSAGQILIHQIVPRLRFAIPKAVTPCGSEDPEELVQDSIVCAAQMLHRTESAGKDVTPGNIAYYTILHMKSGRRSQSCSRADVMAPGTQLDQKSVMHSFEDPMHDDPESDDAVMLGDLLANDHEDPSTLGGRNVDYDHFVESHDPRYAGLLRGVAEGRGFKESAIAAGCGVWSSSKLRRNLARDLREYLGAEAIPDSVRAPSWRGNITANREKAACRHSR